MIRVTSVCVRTPYSTHQRPAGSVNLAEASTLTGVMLSAGSPSSALPSSGLMPRVIVPRVNAPDALKVRMPGLMITGASAASSRP